MKKYILLCLFICFTGMAFTQSIVRVNGTSCPDYEQYFQFVGNCTVSSWGLDGGTQVYLSGDKKFIRVKWNSAGPKTLEAFYTGCANSPAEYNLTIENFVTPSVTLGLSTTQVCEQSGSIQFTATPTNGGSSPQYTWYVDGSGVASGSSNTHTYNTASLAPGNHSAYVVMTSTMTCTTPSASATSAPQSFTVTAKTSFTATLNGPPLICSGTSEISLFVTASGTYGNLTYQWYVNGTPQWNSNPLLLNPVQGTQVYCKVYSDGCVNSPVTTSTYTVNITSSVDPPVSINVTDLNYCPGETIQLSASSPHINGSSTYVWDINGNQFSTSASAALVASATAGPNVFYNGSTASVTVSGLSGECLTTTTKTVTTASIPLNVYTPPSPTFTAGPQDACVGSTGNFYQTQASMTNYQWVVSPGGTITSGGGTNDNSVTVTWNTTSPQSVSVNYTDGNGCTASTPTVRSVTVNPRPTPTISSGPFAACENTGGHIYTTQSGMSGYSWSATGGTVMAGQGTNSATITWNSAGAGTVSVHYIDNNNCASVTPGTRAVTINPRPAPSITAGPVTVCENTSGHEYITQSAMSSYSWSAPGGTITSGQGTDKATITWNSAGARTVSVHYTNINGCASVSPGTRAVTVNPRPTPGIISGPVTVCENTSGHEYTTQSAMTSYLWSAPGGTITSGQGTDKATITWNSNGTQTVSVHYTNSDGCASVTPGTLAVTVNARPTPSIAQGPTTVCSGTSGHEYVTQASMTEYTWSAPGGTITSGQGTEKATITWNSSGTQTVSVHYTGNNSCASVTPGTSLVAVNLTPATIAAVTGNIQFGAGTVHLIANGAGGGEGYRWYNPSDELQDSDSQFDPEVQTSTTNFCYVRTVNSSLCEGPKKWVDINIYAVPVITANNNRVYMGSSATLDAGSGYDSYEWTRSGSGTVLGTTQTLNSNLPDSYMVLVTKGGLSSTSQPFNLLSQLDGHAENYILTNTILQPGITSTLQVGLQPVETVSQSIVYFDGLGRSMQSVSTQGSPSKQDIVQPIVYDSLGREAKKYLPFTAQNNGWYKPNSGIISPATGDYTGIAASFYNNPSDKIADDPKPFSETVFEPSPLNRVLKQGQAGDVWQPDANNSYSSIDRTIKNTYQVNDANEVLKWTYTYPTSAYPLGLVNASNESTPVYYSASELFKSKTKGEQQNEAIEYVDKEGRTILKKVQAGPSEYAEMYYIHDDFGNVVCILPPEAVKAIHKMPASDYFGQTDAAKDNFLKRWAFRYTYDERERITQKQVPGAEPVYMVYDNRDRLVLTQAGNQRTTPTKYWTFTKYDELNRPILTGIKDTAAVITQAQMQVVVNTHYTKSWAKWGEAYVGNVSGNVYGYTNKSYPVVTSGSALNVYNFLTVNYYDSYNFRSLWYGNYAYINDALSLNANGITYNQPVSEFQLATGQVTGTKVKVLDGGVTGGYTWLNAANYYDEKYRIIQTISDNYKGGTDRTSTLYDFVGKVLKTKTIHIEQDIAWKDFYYARQEGNKLIGSGGAQFGMGAVSSQQLPAGQDGWFEFTVTETTTNKVIGLADTNPDAGHASIDYAFHLYYTSAFIQENGAHKATITGLVPGDILRIERTGTTVRYKRNGTTAYTSSTLSPTLLMVDCSFHLSGNTIAGIRSSFSGSSHTVARRFEYDHAGRLLKTHHQIESEPEILVAQNEYNDLGQLVDKKLHNVSGSPVKQSVDYRYNIRGWLTAINESNIDASASDPLNAGESRDLFGMELGYNSDIGLGNTMLYNGNISAVKWSKNIGLGSVKENGYLYTYDALNRISGSTFKEKSASWSALPNGNFTEAGFTYDLNGNILALTRNDGRVAGAMDILDYNYGTGTSRSNKLLKVTDNGDDTKGFTETNHGSDDYVYDVNGNLLWDRNKGGRELLTNGEFVNGGTGWTLTDTGNRLIFVDGRVDAVTGSATSTMKVDYIIQPVTPHVVSINMDRTAGDVVIMVGGGSVVVNTTGITTVSVTSGSGVYTDFSVIAQPNFSGKIYSVSVKGLMNTTYNYLNLPERVSKGSGEFLTYEYDATGRKLSQVLYETGLFKKKTDYVGEFIYEQTPETQAFFFSTTEASDFSAGINGWEASLNCSLEGNQDNIGGVNDALKMTATTNVNNQYYFQKQSVVPIPGEKYLIRANFYIPLTNSTFDGFTITNSSGTQTLVNARNMPKGIWVGYESGLQEYSTGNRFIVRANNGSSIVFNCNGETGYMKNFRVEKATITPEQLKLITHEEGRIIPEADGKYTYQYHLKDHLGNIRVTFTTKDEVESPTATMETANVVLEQSKFLYYEEAVKVNTTLFDHTNAGGTFYSTRLNGSSNERTGLARSISVMPGDTVKTEVYAKYLDTNSSNWTTALNNLITSIANSTAPPGTFIDGGAPGSTGGIPFPYGNLLNKGSETGTAPKAYLNYLIFDRDYNLLNGGFVRMSEAAREYGQDAAHEKLAAEFVITQPGYVYIYLSNDNAALGGPQIEVYFDDFKVTHTKSPVIQSDSYYPFGLAFNSYQRENAVKNAHLYNDGAEREDELDLNVDGTRYRTYDPATSRWWQIDPLADDGDLVTITPYNYSYNNPIRYNDPEGDCPKCPRPVVRYQSTPPNQRIVSREQIITSYKHNNRLVNMNGPRESVSVGDSENPQTAKGQIITAVGNLADNMGLGDKLQSLQVSMMKVETISTDGAGNTKNDGSEIVFTGRDAVKLEGMEQAYQDQANAAFDTKFASFANDKLGTDFNSLSPEAQAEFKVSNIGAAGLIRNEVQSQMGASPKQQVIAHQQQLLQQGVTSQEVTRKRLPTISQGH